MGLLTGLFRASRKRLMTTDNDMGMFRDKLNELVAQKDTLSDEEISQRVEELKGITNDLPDDEGKAKLVRFLEDFKSVKEQDAKVAEEAAKTVADEFEKLDTAAMQDVPGAEVAPEEETTETDVEEVVEETAAPETEEEVEVDSEEEKDVTDDDPNAEYSLEEIYQFVKKRMAEDAACEEETDEEITDGDPAEEIEEKEEEEVVTDCAPRIPVTVNDKAAKGSLSELFELAKRG